MPSNKWADVALTVVLFLTMFVAIGAGSLALAIYLRMSGLVPNRDYEGGSDLDNLAQLPCGLVFVVATAIAGAICFRWWRQERRG